MVEINDLRAVIDAKNAELEKMNNNIQKAAHVGGDPLVSAAQGGPPPPPPPPPPSHAFSDDISQDEPPLW